MFSDVHIHNNYDKLKFGNNDYTLINSQFQVIFDSASSNLSMNIYQSPSITYSCSVLPGVACYKSFSAFCIIVVQYCKDNQLKK